MSRLIPQSDMTSDQITDTSYDVIALLVVAKAAADRLHDDHSARLASSLASVLELALELQGVVHDAIETHEGVKGGGA